MLHRTRAPLPRHVVGAALLLCLAHAPLSAQTLTLPTHLTKSSASTLFWITQSGKGYSGEFNITNAKSTAAALQGTTAGTGIGVYGASTSGYGIRGDCSTGPGIYGTSTSNAGVSGYNLASGIGVYGYSGNNYGVYGASPAGAGVYGTSTSGYAVYGYNPSSGYGVYGYSGDNYAVRGDSKSGDGIHGLSTTGYGVYGESSGGDAGYFKGNVVVTGTFSNPSDARYKTHVTTLPNALDTVLQLRGVCFDWNREKFKDMHFSGGRQVGFIAQEVEKVLPNLVVTDKNGYRSLDYIHVVPVLVEAIKEENRQARETSAENAALKAQLAEQDARLVKLESAKSPGKATVEGASLGLLLLAGTGWALRGFRKR